LKVSLTPPESENGAASLRHGALFSESWLNRTGGRYTLDAVFSWIERLNKTVSVDIHKTHLDKTSWFYDESSGQIVNGNRSFFQLAGFVESGGNGVLREQPIIIQDEIGYLGILCKEFDGVLHFLMQAKIEPGNVNKIQISPTVQATWSNFTRKHGGKRPEYLDYFVNAARYTVITDQLQSEQSSRFLKKRNRNIIVMLDKDEPIDELPSHKWLTLGQIKALMRLDNIVNMDTRTVLSGIPFYQYKDALRALVPRAKELPLINSICACSDEVVLTHIYQCINNYKMLSETHTQLVPLYSLKNWEMITTESGDEFVCKKPFPFKVIFCDISIEGREVRRWSQPLIEATGMATFGLFTTVENNVRLFLVKARPEIGCFDKIELGPAIQLEAVGGEMDADAVTQVFLQKYREKDGVKYDVVLSEEGGRFYCEQNYNIIIEIDKNEIGDLPPGYFWVNYNTLNRLTQMNNCLNIQMRNLLSLLEIEEHE
jgi:oxidase EvaA